MSYPPNNSESADVGSGDFPKRARTGERSVRAEGRAWLIQRIKMLTQAMKRMAQVQKVIEEQGFREYIEKFELYKSKQEKPSLIFFLRLV